MPELGPLADDAERLDADVHADPARAPHAQLPGLQLARLQRPSLLSGHAGIAQSSLHLGSNNLDMKSENLDKKSVLSLGGLVKKISKSNFYVLLNEK